MQIKPFKKPGQAKRYWNLLRSIDNRLPYFQYKVGKRGRLTLRTRKTRLRITLNENTLGTFKEIFMNQVYPVPFLKKHITQPRPVIMDIGAHTGVFAAFILEHFPACRMVCAEPLAGSYALLVHNVKQNEKRVPASIHVINKAIYYGEEQTMEIYYDGFKENDVEASLIKGFRKGNARSSIQVPVVSYSEVIRDLGIRSVDLLKLDCEGSEYNILYRMPLDELRSIRTLMAEVHDLKETLCNVHDLSEYLERNGFSSTAYRLDRDTCLLLSVNRIGGHNTQLLHQ